MSTQIKLGQCYLAQFHKKVLPIRIEKFNPNGGWFARVLTHGRIVQVRGDTQLIRILDSDEVRAIAQGVIPNHRSSVQGIILRNVNETVTQNEQSLNNLSRSNSVKRYKRSSPREVFVVARMNILDAASRVLCENEVPMTTREIVEVAREKCYWVSDAATPHATLHAALSRDIKLNEDKSSFKKAERGKFTLR
ncbi:MAG: winged helix-turn-helix domain-containing protein [Planctomycetaceae bacterium]|jgi:hypothetical protein|nr:winged helix-turn-helix domain-containing protein [Planctomycetaceae bacterium]